MLVFHLHSFHIVSSMFYTPFHSFLHLCIECIIHDSILYPCTFPILLFHKMAAPSHQPSEEGDAPLPFHILTNTHILHLHHIEIHTYHSKYQLYYIQNYASNDSLHLHPQLISPSQHEYTLSTIYHTHFNFIFLCGGDPHTPHKLWGSLNISSVLFG